MNRIDLSFGPEIWEEEKRKEGTPSFGLTSFFSLNILNSEGKKEEIYITAALGRKGVAFHSIQFEDAQSFGECVVCLQSGDQSW